VKHAKELRCFDLCCGAGALSSGFRSAGATILGGIDVDKHALETASFNHGDGKWQLIGIEQFAASIEGQVTRPHRKVNTLLAGLPCQGFSAAGNRDPSDERNYLYRSLLRIIQVLLPEHVVVENVVGITTPTNRHVLRALTRRLRKLGYSVGVRILNAFEFGVPQNRKRVFVVGVRSGLADWVFECLNPISGPRSVRDAFSGLPRKKERRRQSHVFMSHGPGVTHALRKLKPGGPISYRRLEWIRPSPTLVAGHRALPVHPSEPRAISVREAARLQGFEDSYRFFGSNSAQIGQVANAVPPPLAEALARGLSRYRGYGERTRGPIFRKLAGRDTPALRRRLTRTFLSAKKRKFPWRLTADPYRILVTEMLLQRTNADLASQVWREVLNYIPTPSLAAEADVRRLGALTRRIGIWSRAYAMKRLGEQLTTHHRGTVPQAFDQLMRLPGVGIYIASAVRALSFGKQDFPVDGNGFRFVSRYFGISLRGKKSEARQLREFMSPLVPRGRSREYVYGFLDFAATTCRPRRPLCHKCPLRASCAEHRALK
jgi:DNA (cytosine-5)-methyltransferase 1